MPGGGAADGPAASTPDCQSSSWLACIDRVLRTPERMHDMQGAPDLARCYGGLCMPELSQRDASAHGTETVGPANLNRARDSSPEKLRSSGRVVRQDVRDARFSRGPAGTSQRVQKLLYSGYVDTPWHDLHLTDVSSDHCCRPLPMPQGLCIWLRRSHARFMASGLTPPVVYRMATRTAPASAWLVCHGPSMKVLQHWRG